MKRIEAVRRTRARLARLIPPSLAFSVSLFRIRSEKLPGPGPTMSHAKNKKLAVGTLLALLGGRHATAILHQAVPRQNRKP